MIKKEPENMTSKLTEQLFDAIRYDDIPAVDTALRMGADLHATDENGNTALMEAAYNGHDGILEYLLQKGADVNAANDFKSTALGVAVFRNEIACVKTLLRHKATVDAENDFGETPLIYTAMYGHTELAKVLIAHGADPERESNHNKKTPKQAAKEHGNRSVTEILDAAILEKYQKQEEKAKRDFLRATESHKIKQQRSRQENIRQYTKRYRR